MVGTTLDPLTPNSMRHSDTGFGTILAGPTVAVRPPRQRKADVGSHLPIPRQTHPAHLGPTSAKIWPKELRPRRSPRAGRHAHDTPEAAIEGRKVVEARFVRAGVRPRLEGRRRCFGRATLVPGALMLGNPGACFECGHDHGVGDRCLLAG